MDRLSIRRQIMGIAVGLIVLMAAASVLSMAMVKLFGDRLEQLTTSYIPAYGDLARANIRSLERALALRRMIIAKSQTPPDETRFAADRSAFDAKGAEVEREAQAARALINGLIEEGSTFTDGIALARIASRLDAAIDDHRRHLNDEIKRLLALLDGEGAKTIADELARVDTLRDDLNQKIEAIRSDMLGLVRADAVATLRNQQRAMLIGAVLTALAAALGLVFSTLVSSGVTRPVRRLLEGTRAVEAGRLDEEAIAVTSQDEIGHLTAAFNRMIVQLRNSDRGRVIEDNVGLRRRRNWTPLCVAAICATPRRVIVLCGPHE